MKEVLFHGSSRIVASPFLGGGNEHNDYGPGFYCTEDIGLAGEWACTGKGEGAFVNHYSLDPSIPLKVGNLTKDGHILNWLAVLVKNRSFAITAPFPLRARAYLLETFLPDLSAFDILVGYRADDSYFSFANAFLNNTLSLEQLRRAMHLGKLGEQVVMKSETAFKALTFLSAEPVPQEIYYPRRMARDRKAREDFARERESTAVADAVYMIDILRENWKNDDPRLR